ncbi:BID domain-containing T4SS effector [Bartonella rattimassiliensis]|uniref:Bartonella effector protein BID domain-containing protein n=1 Tax=Bartonella rattimassiliensis 15908 TaxID=1094556 RepID=J0ZAV1_9HYPH|nr:BID domain-containing T4SS effector [Bartonella rattimassiliensis]EJF84958.1 hypothetical protein MCY_01341 [Bartonella rattimassiliensis 15908]
MKKSHPPSSSLVDELRKRFEQQNQENPNPDPLYARVNKSPKRQPSPEPIEKTVYAPQTPLAETIYAPQQPPEGAYDAPNSRRAPVTSSSKLVEPYEIVNLSTGDPEFQRRTNPLYEPSSNGGRTPQKPEEHLYSELNFDQDNGHPSQKPVESLYATVGIGAQGGQDSQQLENPLYAGIGSGRTTPPPRSPKDELTTNLLKNVHFQQSVQEVQKWCTIVYDNQHALNQQLAKVLNDPQNAENILWDFAENPESSAKLAGRQLLGVKSSERRAAEDGFSSLFSAFEKHVHITQRLHKEFTRELERSQRQESPERDTEHGHHHHHRPHHRHARGQGLDSPEHSPQRQRHEEKRPSYAM